MKMNKLLSIEVKGREHRWSFDFYGNPKYLDEWREDGLEVNEIENTVPEWVPGWAVKPWCFFQDLFNFKYNGG
jgi:hypothetical protein